MQFRFLALALSSAVLISVGSAQTPTQQQIDALKNLPQDQQDALLQGVLGKGDGTGTKTDPRLQVPQTIQSKTGEGENGSRRFEKTKTSDGRDLRIPGEDPELRADDSVLIDLTPLDAPVKESSDERQNGAKSGVNNNTGNNNPLSEGDRNNDNKPDQISKHKDNGDFGRIQVNPLAKTEAEQEKTEKLRQRILRDNPYRLNRFGVLEIPGLAAIPLAGLTAEEATGRLSADPDLRNFVVKLTLLRLRPLDDSNLKPYGYDLFEGVPSTFAPVSDIQVPIDYVVGPGDTLKVQLYGNEPANYSLTVARDGTVNFPKLGPISVNGMPFDSARAAIESRVSRQFIGTRVNVTMGDLRSIRVFVLGDVEKAGSYSVSGLSTMTNALFVSGGVKKIGSLRNIELKRNGQVVTVLDLYDLLLAGDTSRDRHLMPGDVIFVPPIGGTVSVFGAVRRPAIYEIKPQMNITQVLQMAGGLLPDADGTVVQVEHIQPSRGREMVSVDLATESGRSAAIGNGDKLRVPAIRPTLEHSVSLSGYVFRPGAFEYRAGLRLSDILSSFDELRPNADRHYIMIRREVPPEERIEVISADLEQALKSRGSAADPELKPRDQILVFDLSASRERVLAPIIRDLELQGTPERPVQTVNIDGRVEAPGRYPLEPNMRVSDLIRAGGSLEDASYLGDAELARYEIKNGISRQSELIRVDLESIRRGEVSADLLLEPYDQLLIKTIPQWQQAGEIELTGEVRFPGKYPVVRGELLSDVLKRAGGLTDLAFADGAVFIRDELKAREKDQIQVLVNRLQSDLAALSLEAVASSAATANANGATGATQALGVGQQLLSQLRDTKPVGRLVINLHAIMTGRPGSTGDVEIRDGDRLLVPKRTQEITILGEVQSPTSHIFQEGLTRDDYIAKSGGITQKADRKHIYVVRANGDVVSGGGRHGWFRRTQALQIRPGDTIVVPLDTERVRALPLWQAVTTIIYNLAVALLAVRSV
jgi:polysaccharide biosynthesis/export protein